MVIVHHEVPGGIDSGWEQGINNKHAQRMMIG